MLGWLRRFRRSREVAFPSEWRRALDGIRWVGRLEPGARARLERAVRAFVAEKSWEGCGGLVVTDEMRVVVAAHAAMLALGLPGDAYRRVRAILIYPSTFVNPGALSRDDAGVFHEGGVHAGESWHEGGPVIVAWDEARAGAAGRNGTSNVLFHEFAHKLDLLDGWADGTPPIARRAEFEAWRDVMRESRERLSAAVERGDTGVLDPYAATNPAEFFAVATEAFFMAPRALRRGHPALFDRLAAYYRYAPPDE